MDGSAGMAAAIMPNDLSLVAKGGGTHELLLIARSRSDPL